MQQENNTSMDHKELGRVLDLFSFDENVPGVVYWHPKGWALFNLVIKDLSQKLTIDGYEEINTARIISTETLKKSGHFDNYYDRLFFVGNDKELKNPKWCLKPMSCPGSLKIFKEQIHSYKELPIKYAEFGSVYRYEQAGEVNGLFRVRNMTQDDAHVYCLESQVEPEIQKLIDFTYITYKRYGFTDIRIELSTRPEKSIGSDEQWEKAESGLKKALEEKKIKYNINKGDGAFYGPKIDFHIKDSVDRSWQMGTIQLDFAMAERLDANYIDQDGNKKHPIMIHRAIFGSLERYIGILLEHTAGALPFWLSPVQIEVLPVSEKHIDYAKKVAEELKDYRVEIDERNESVGKKIRDTEIQKIPYMIVVGDKEEKDNSVTVRSRGSKDLITQKVTEFIQALKI